MLDVHAEARQDVLRFDAVHRYDHVPVRRKPRVAIFDALPYPAFLLPVDAEPQGTDQRRGVAPRIRDLAGFALFRGPPDDGAFTIGHVRVHSAGNERGAVRPQMPRGEQVRPVDPSDRRPHTVGRSFRPLPNLVNNQSIKRRVIV